MTKQSATIPATLNLPALGESLTSLTGEDTRLPRLSVPQITISYKDEDDTTKAEGEKKGEFVEFDTVSKVRKSLGKSITIQVLHHRRSLSSFKDEGSSIVTFFTPEVSMKATELSLFRTQSSAGQKGKTQFIAKTALKTLRERFPDLGYRQTMYVLHEGVLKGLVVKGASFGKFIDLQKALGGTSSSAQQLVLTTEKGKKGTVTYFATVFTPGDKSDMAALKPVMEELAAWFAKHDELQAANQQAKSDEAAVARGDGPSQTPATASVIAGVPTSTPEAIEDELDFNIPTLEAIPVKESDLPF